MSDFDEAELIEDNFYLNGKVVVDDDYQSALEWIYEKLPSFTVCPFCSCQLESLTYLVEHSYFTNEFEEYHGESGKKAELGLCLNCTYWQWHFEDGLSLNSFGCPDHFWHGALSKVKEYTYNLPSGCHSDIAVALRRKPSLCHSLDPYELEKFVASVFKANYSDCEVFHVGRPDDGGVDVVFVDSGEIRWLIQVKRRERADASEGVSTIRNLLGTMILEDSSNGIVVSTADHFTYRAYQAAGRANEKGLQIKLMDKGKLIRMVGPLLPDRPWLNFVKLYYPDLSEVFSRRFMLLQEINSFTA